MGHGHGHHHHGHEHGHDHGDVTAALPAAFDASVPDEALTPEQRSRRSLLRRAGLLGAGLTAASVLGQAAATAPAYAAPDSRRRKGFLWLAGDHLHTQYSNDGKYRVVDQVRQGARHGMDWMVITDHGNATHARIGVEKVNPDIREARTAYGDTLVFQGLEWNIPGAEHGTVFVHPGKHEVSVLKQFETGYDGSVKGATDSTPANEALAVAGLDFLAQQVRHRKVKDALMLANHPARKGIDSPHEIRAWRDATPGRRIAVGMEGAPGHQAAGIRADTGMGRARGLYDGSPGVNSFAGYPLESYRTWGGFDWMTATVGGLWDSLLAEGKPWWITANSDSHNVYTDTAVRGPNSDYAVNGKHEDPVYGGKIDLTEGDYWPGQYSRTHVGADGFSYAAVMDGIRAGRIWVDHGGLLSGLDVRVLGGSRWATLGGALHVRKGTKVTLTVDVALAGGANWAGFIPKLARVDVIRGDVTGAPADKDTFTAPTAKVVKSYEVNKSTGTVRLTYELGRVDRPLYVRLRGSDGNRSAVGARGAAVDPAGPAIDVVGDADPWRDLWFYSNPVWVLPS
ncbi:PHP domain-containing protein [Streptomyces europaeiscabiei]|uniref:PHP domain-containing protein n=1 Tax=Streptomyces europaeiscabiei TaxID=146819 RepID=UPI0029A10567|nr:PHP domain-containing protein [Streptomyces europaeiscabiei]MDX3692202.1 PHP domain-containing protein [Streptomyces europaeiscabiei]